jgi:hypothetical protein
MAVSVAPLTTTVMNSIGQERAGIASGVNNAVSRIAGLLAIALLGIVMLQSFNHALDAKLSTLSLPASVPESLQNERGKLAAVDLSQRPSQIRIPVQEAIAQSFVSGFRRVMLIGAGLAALSALTALGLISARPGTTPD